MAEIIGAKVVVDGDGALKTVGSLRTQLKAALTDLQGIQEQFGDISPEAQKAAKAVAELRDRIKDSNEVASLFDPEKKFQAVVGVAQGIASGFAAAQGAMALFGAESKEVEQALLKVQAVMALSQGLSGIRAATEDFKRLIAVLANMSIVQKANAAANALAAGTMRLFGAATTQTSVAFNVLKGAIVSTGIGALVVALGIAVNKIMDLTSSTNDAAEAQKKLNAELEETANTFTDEIVDIYEQDAQLQIARAKAAGKTEAEIADIRRKANEQIISERAKNLSQQKVDSLDAAEAQKAYNKSVTDNELFELGVQQKNREEAEAKRKEASEKAAADKKKRDEEDKKNAERLKELSEQNVQEIKARGEREAQQRADDDAAFKASLADRAAAQIAAQDEQLERDKEQAAARKAIDEAELDHKRAMANAAANVLTGLASLAGEQTAVGKVLAITGATIATYASAQQAYWAAFNPTPTYLSPVLGALYAAAAVATGIANIKRIASVQVPGKGGGGNVPNISTNAPLTPSRPPTPTTRIDQDSINNIGSAMPARAYVVESDITGKQQRISRIQQAAKFE